MKRKSKNDWTGCFLFFLFAGCCMPLSALAATYYLDTITGSDSNLGTEALPWRTWQKAQAALIPGDTVLLTGTFGNITVAAGDPVGTSTDWITYRAWPGKPAPQFSYILSDHTIKNAYLNFIGIHVDPGYTDNPHGAAVELMGMNYVTFADSYFEGEKVAGTVINQADFAPYVFMEGKIITSGPSPMLASHITINNCTFKNAYRGIYACQHPNSPDRKVENWTITHNDISDMGEDGITTSVGGVMTIADNYFHNQIAYKVRFIWPGNATGDWSSKQWQKLTQDTTGASAIVYKMDSDTTYGGSSNIDVIYLYADDKNNLPRRSNTYTWRLDSDAGIYFTPVATGDNAHADFIAAQSSSHDIVIERNIFCVAEYGTQVIKIEPPAVNITFRNNLVYSPFHDCYLLLLAGYNVRLYNNIIDIVGNTGHYAGALRMIIGSFPDIDNSDTYFYNNIISGAVYSQGTIHSDYNIWRIAPPSEFNEGPHSITVSHFDSLFADRANFNYQPAPNSPAVNFGDPANAAETDILGYRRGTQPDAGCYEYDGANNSVLSQPTPFNPENNRLYYTTGAIMLSGLTRRAVIKIFTLSGELVYEYRNNNTGIMYTRQAVNAPNKPLAGGVHIYLINYPDIKQTSTGKIIITR